MVYAGTPPLLNHHGYRDKCSAYIDPSLSVARAGEDIGNVAVWLCSEADRFVTGQSILVDGGFNIADAR